MKTMKTLNFPMIAVLAVTALWLVSPHSLRADEVYQPKVPMPVKVLVISYFPVKGDLIDVAQTGDWGAPLKTTRENVARQTKELVHALTEGSRYHGYKDNSAKPSLEYKVADTFEFLEPVPLLPHSGRQVPMTDYTAILKRVNIKKYVEQQDVKEVWLWGYRGGKAEGWESTMSGPYGNISNSARRLDEMPLLSKSYTLYHYNYQRGTSEATECHIHQIEAVLNFADGRDFADGRPRTPPSQWSSLLFWGKFVGSDATNKIIHPGCGWAHYPPNAVHDYDWGNTRYVETDIEDWRPDGTGKKQRMNCDRWHGNSLEWFVYWMQNIPGANHGLTYQGKPLVNWWVFLGDFDNAMKRKMTLVGP